MKQFVVGLTGPTGAGKTLFCEVAGPEFAHIDCDKVAHEAMDSNTVEQLVQRFGTGILDSEGRLNRKKLAQIAFADQAKTALLEQITHPAILQRVNRKMEHFFRQGKPVILDAPRLFESGTNTVCNCTVAVLADPDVRLERILKRDALTIEQARNRMAAQKPDIYYRERADYLLYNNGDREGFIKNAKEVKASLVKRMHEEQD